MPTCPELISSPVSQKGNEFMHLFVSPEELEALGHTENSVCLGLNNKGSLETGLLKNVLALNVLLCVSAHDLCVGGHAEVRGQLCRASSLLSSLYCKRI